MTRFPALLASALLTVTGLGVAGASPAIAAPAATPCAAGTPLSGDYDGDGAPEALIWQSAYDHDRHWSVNAAGSATKVLDAGDITRNADLNGDVCSDVIVSGWVDGEASLVLGSPSGLASATPIALKAPWPADAEDADFAPAIGLRHDGISQVVFAGKGYEDFEYKDAGTTVVYVYTLAADGTPGTPQVIQGSTFGAQRLTTEPTVSDGSGSTFAFGSPSDRVGKAVGAGAVYVFSADTTNPSKMVFRTRLTQNSPGVPDTAEKGDHFGTSLSLRDDRLAIGVPGENIGRARDAGLVQPVLWRPSTHRITAYRAIHQGTSGVVGTNESNDEFGTVVQVTRGLTATGSYDIAIGTPYEKVGTARAAGSVTVANFSAKVFRTYTENSSGVPGKAEQTDFLGWSLSALPTSATTDTMYAGAVNESVGVCDDAGVVLRTDGKRLSRSSVWTSIPPPQCSEAETMFGLWIAR